MTADFGCLYRVAAGVGERSSWRGIDFPLRDLKRCLVVDASHGTARGGGGKKLRQTGVAWRSYGFQVQVEWAD